MNAFGSTPACRCLKKPTKPNRETRQQTEAATLNAATAQNLNELGEG